MILEYDRFKIQNYRVRTGKTPVAIVDIDGVMVDINHRLGHIVQVVDGVSTPSPTADWNTFHSLKHLDTAGMFVPVVKNFLRNDHTGVIFVTARQKLSEDIVQQLVAKLEEVLHLGKHEFAGLIMREKDCNLGVVEYKRSVVRQLRADGLNLLMGVDDSHEICQMFIEEQLPSLRFMNHITPDRFLY